MSDELLFDRLDQWAVDSPNASAVASVDGPRHTYRELSERSNQFARQLVESGVQPGDRVALCMAKGPDAIVAMLGTNKAGAAYVPIDPESPAIRAGLVLSASEPRLIVADADAADLVTTATIEGTAVATLERVECASSTFDVVFDATDVDRQDGSPTPRPPIGSDDLAHVLFTSGSTGVPKGVMITHANVTAFIDWAVNHFGYRPDDRVSGHSPLHFDLSTFDIYGAFASGATLYPVPSVVNINPANTAEWIRACGLTQWFSVPSALNLLVRFDVIEPGDFPTLRRLMWCGEVLPTRTLITLMERLPHATFTNLYGPTEATIASSWFQVDSPPDDSSAPLPIGQPCTGERLVVLAAEGDEAATDVVGDLYIGGVGLSPGYWRDDEKTASAFRTDLDGGGRLYKTGDLAKLLPSGDYLFVGRSDSQIKSRGHRIELGEIELALQAVDLVDDSAVVAIESGGFDGMAICAAYVSSSAVKPSTLAKALAERVPRYMIPQRWLQLDELPTNVNGKVDRPALRDRFSEDLTARSR